MCMYCGQPFLCLITQILQQEYTTKYIFCRVTVKYLILKKIKKKFLPLFWIVPTSTIWLCCVLLFALVLVVLGWVDTWYFCVFIFFWTFCCCWPLTWKRDISKWTKGETPWTPLLARVAPLHPACGQLSASKQYINLFVLSKNKKKLFKDVFVHFIYLYFFLISPERKA